MLAKINNILGILSITLLSVALYVVFCVVPNERVMGPVQRIFYFHVGSAFACYCSFALVFIAGVSFLVTRQKKHDFLAQSASEVGFVFCSACLVTGMIWGQVAWNTPFRLEPRLVATLVLWFIFFAILLLRAFGDPTKIKSHAAVLGIVGALTVPLVVYSIDFLPQFAQLHPKVIDRQGLRDPWFGYGLAIASLALITLQAALIVFRYRIAVLEDR